MKKSYATPFAIAGAVLIAALLAVTNYLTTPDTLWCIYPIYAVVWWPVGVFLCRRKRYFAFAATGGLITIAFLAAVNLIISPQDLLFLYAVPPLLMLPAGVYFREKMLKLPIAALLGALITAYFVAVNLLLTPQHFWAIYPIYAALWWPLGTYFAGRGDYKKLSAAGALLTIAFLIMSNFLTTTYPWALYACFPVILWPAAMYSIKRIGGLKFSVIAAACLIAWYGALNILLAPGSPWVIFVAFGVLWWPLSVSFYGRRCPHIYAVVMGALSIAFFSAVNAVYSPGAVWALYPAFGVLWWPVTLLFAHAKKWLSYSFTASAMIIAFLTAVNIMTSPGFPWCVFPALGVLWWPLAMYFKGKKRPFGFSVAGALLVIITLVTINLLASGPFLWFVFPSLAVLWWPAAVYFAKKKNPFGFSIAGVLLASALFAAINFMTSPGFPWCAFPIFVALWWPLSVYFHYVRRRRLQSQKHVA